MKLHKPWPANYKINKRSPFGWRVHPITRRRKFHHGIDVALPVGTPLTAPADGEIVHKGNSASGGNTLVIKHAPDLFTVYYHLQKPPEARVGDKVKLGDVIAHSGNTGASTGPHLHFEVRKSQNWGDTLDPVPFFQES
jgi:murein DD-endopeptidase MepM/ murein hydrolase activator NlpD